MPGECTSSKCMTSIDANPNSRAIFPQYIPKREFVPLTRSIMPFRSSKVLPIEFVPPAEFSSTTLTLSVSEWALLMHSAINSIPSCLSDALPGLKRSTLYLLGLFLLKIMPPYAELFTSFQFIEKSLISLHTFLLFRIRKINQIRPMR